MPLSSIQTRWENAVEPLLRQWWARHGESSLRAAIPVMLVAAAVWLSYELWRLLWGDAPIWPTSPTGAVDLKLLHRLVHDWFAGRPVYLELAFAVHPPATYVLLWPLLGWLEVGPARWLWAFTTALMLAALIHLLVRESGADTRLERAFIASIPCAIYATGAAIGNGQLIVHLLPLLLAALLILRRAPCSLSQDVVASGLLIATLVKPPIAVPFLWLPLLVARAWRPMLLMGIGYGLLTLFAMSFQAAAPGELLEDWRSRSAALAVTGGHGNVANLHVWLGSLGLEGWIFPASLIVWLTLGFWIHRNRDAEFWLLLGVTAIVARYWTYHRWYDDVLLLLPMVALFRMARQGSGAAGVLLGAALLLMLAPGGLFLLPAPWDSAYVFGQTVLWAVTLILFHRRARAQRVRALGRPPGSSPPTSAALARPRRGG